MTFHILTIFPNIFESYFNESIIKRAQEKNLIDIKTYNLRDFTEDKHKKVDDAPYGGGPGMVLKVEPIYKAVTAIKQSLKAKKSKLKVRTILFSTRGKIIDEKIAARLAKYKKLILICGRYEGVDERVARHIADEEISLGNFTLAGGELPAMALIEVVARFVPGVLGKTKSLETIKGSYPAYTRPEIFKPSDLPIGGQNPKSEIRNPKSAPVWRVPKILLSGNHKKIEEWRKFKE